MLQPSTWEMGSLHPYQVESSETVHVHMGWGTVSTSVLLHSYINSLNLF